MSRKRRVLGSKFKAKVALAAIRGQTANQFDFGDAPDTYKTLNASGGAKHQLGGSLFLGATVDGEPDGDPDIEAEEDDLDQLPNDEDGLVRTSLFIAGEPASIDVVASASGRLDAWLDLNGNGRFDHPEEHIDEGDSVSVSPTSPPNLGSTAFSRVASTKSSLHFSLVYFGQAELEAI